MYTEIFNKEFYEQEFSFSVAPTWGHMIQRVSFCCGPIEGENDIKFLVLEVQNPQHVNPHRRVIDLVLIGDKLAGFSIHSAMVKETKFTVYFHKMKPGMAIRVCVYETDGKDSEYHSKALTSQQNFINPFFLFDEYGSLVSTDGNEYDERRFPDWKKQRDMRDAQAKLERELALKRKQEEEQAKLKLEEEEKAKEESKVKQEAVMVNPALTNEKEIVAKKTRTRGWFS